MYPSLELLKSNDLEIFSYESDASRSSGGEGGRLGNSFPKIGSANGWGTPQSASQYEDLKFPCSCSIFDNKDNIITHLKLAEAQTVSDNVAFHFCYDHKKVISGLHLKSDDTVHHAQATHHGGNLSTRGLANSEGSK